MLPAGMIKKYINSSDSLNPDLTISF